MHLNSYLTTSYLKELCMKETTFTAPDIECGGCAASIEKVLGRQIGIETVIVNIPAKAVAVRYDEAWTNPTKIAETLSDIGFPAQE
jgi:copper chaperone